MRLIHQAEAKGRKLLVWADDDTDSIIVIHDTGKDVERLMLKRKVWEALGIIIAADGKR